MPFARFVLALAASALLASPALAATDPDPDLGSYGLDDIPRTVAPKGKFVCPEVPLVTYRGDLVRFRPSARVYTGFVERLRCFEAVVAEVATRFYGRPPRTVRDLGTYNCRRIARYPDLLSEHALGDGIDVAGFDFGPLPKGAQLPDGVPKSVRRTFSISVEKDWDADPDAASHKARFMRALTDALVARGDIFRVLLGPAYPGHKDHLHLDCAPYRLVVL